MEVTILKTDIEFRAHRVIYLREKLPGELAVAVSELVNSSVAGACADSASNSTIPAQIQPAVQHGVPDVGSSVDSEVSVEWDGSSSARIDRVDEGGLEIFALNLAMHVAELALEPEHAEVIASDYVDVGPRLVLEATN